jgi:hypothetical protein
VYHLGIVEQKYLERPFYEVKSDQHELTKGLRCRPKFFFCSPHLAVLSMIDTTLQLIGLKLSQRWTFCSPDEKMKMISTPLR